MLELEPTTQLRKKILKFCEPSGVFRKIPLEQLKEYEELIQIDAIHNILENDELMHTVKVFFENNLNLSATSKNAFMHRNTLIYRLEKIKKEIGLNVKNFEDARILKNIMLINGVLKEKNKG